MRDPALDHDSDSVWTQIADLFVRGQSYTDFRLDRLDRNVATLQTDVAELKADVAVIKTDVAVIKTDAAVIKTDVVGLSQKMDQHHEEVRSDSRKVIAALEQLKAYIERDEKKVHQVSDDD